MSRRPSMSVLALAALAAALLPARGDSWRGRFVSVPAELEQSGVLPANFPTAVSDGVPGRLPLSSSAYVAVCALGDMAMERRYVPSKGGAASAPAGPLLTCMAEDGWETPRASRHAQLYDLVYGEIARAPETIELDNGVKVYPLCLAGLGVPDLATNANGKCSFGYYDMPPPLFAAGDWGGDNTNAENAAAAALREMLERRGLRAETSWPETFDNTARFKAKMLGAIGMNRGPDAHPHYYGSGIRTGSPLWAIDPLEANYALSLAYATPVAIPAAAAWDDFSNRVWIATNSVTVSVADVQTVADALVRAGGGVATLQSTLVSSMWHEQTPVAGLPRYEEKAKFMPDNSYPRVLVKWLCEETTDDGFWETFSQKRVSDPNGVLTVRRRRVNTTTKATLDSVRVADVGSGIEDLKVFTSTAPAYATNLVKDVGWPHPSSEAWIGGTPDNGGRGNVWAVLLGRRHRRDVTANGAVTSNSVGVVLRKAHSRPIYVFDPKPALPAVMSAAYREYLDAVDDVPQSSGSWTVSLNVVAPKGVNGSTVSHAYSVTFDPDPSSSTNYPTKTVYFDNPKAEDDDDVNPSKFTLDSVYDPKNNSPEGYSWSSTPPADGEPYYVVETVTAWFSRSDQTNGGYSYTETKSAWLDLPDVFAFVFWDFTSL